MYIIERKEQEDISFIPYMYQFFQWMYFFFDPYLMKKPWRWGQWTYQYLIFIRTNPFDCPRAVISWFFFPFPCASPGGRLRLGRGIVSVSDCRGAVSTEGKRRSFQSSFRQNTISFSQGNWRVDSPELKGSIFFPSLPTFLSVPSSGFFCFFYSFSDIEPYAWFWFWIKYVEMYFATEDVHA